MKKTNTNEKGFTIIEVVLVLAIAALIFLMVFIALPTLQRNQRDSQRRQDMSRVISQISSYQSNNRGKVPPLADMEDNSKFIARYLDGTANFVDPKGTAYEFVAPTSNDQTGESNQIFYHVNKTCDGENAADPTVPSTRLAAIRLTMEDNGVICLNTQD